MDSIDSLKRNSIEVKSKGDERKEKGGKGEGELSVRATRHTRGDNNNH